MRLRAEREVLARLADLDLEVHFDRGEELLTEISSKFRRAGITEELAAAQLRLREWWTDAQQYFAVSLAG
jgi:L-histidine N-alpha-methyltransferase